MTRTEVSVQEGRMVPPMLWGSISHRATAGRSSAPPWTFVSEDLPKHQNWTQNKAILKEHPMESSLRVTLFGS